MDSIKAQKGKKLSKLYKITLYTISAFLICSSALFWGLPFTLEFFLKKKFSAYIERKVTIENIDFNPLTLELSLKDFGIKEKTGPGHLIFLKKFHIDFSSLSFLNQAVIVSELEIDSPEMNITRNEDMTYNFQDVVKKIRLCAGLHEKSNLEKLRFSINNIQIQNGLVNIMDVPEEAAQLVEKIDLSIPFISNFSHAVDIFVTPHFFAVINGSPFESKGNTKPFNPERETSINIDIEHLDLKRFFAYLSDLFNINLKSGALEANATISFIIPDSSPPSIQLEGNITIENFLALENDQKTVIAFEQLNIKLLPSKLLDGMFRAEKVSFEKPQIHLKRQLDEDINPPQLLDIFKKLNTKGKNNQLFKDYDISIKSLSLASGNFIFTNDISPDPLELKFQNINFSMENFSNLENSEAFYNLSLSMSQKTSLHFKGLLSVREKRMLGVVEINAIDLSMIPKLIPSFFNEDIFTGSARIKSDYRISFNHEEKVDVRMDNINAGIFDIALSSQDNERVAAIKSATLEDGLIDKKNNLINIKNIKIDGGTFSLDKFVNEMSKMSARYSSLIGNHKKDNNWLFKVGEIGIQNYEVLFKNKKLTKNRAIRLKPVDFKAENLSNAPESETSIEFNADIAEGGTIHIKGESSLLHEKASLDISIKAFSIENLQGLLPLFSDHSLQKGNLYTTGKLEVQNFFNHDPNLSFKGDVDITNMEVNDLLTNENFFLCENMAARGIQISTRRKLYTVSKIQVQDFFNTIEIGPTGKLVQRIFKRPEKRSKLNHSKGKNENVIKVNSMLFKRGSIKFIDNRIKPQFISKISDINGIVTDFYPATGERASVMASAKTGKKGRIDIKGTTTLFSEKNSSDITVNFKDIEVVEFSPYSKKYFGYEIDGGKLEFTLKFHLNDNKVSVDNAVLLDQFMLGNSIKTKDATYFPIRKAVSIFKDLNGSIRFDIPVNGDLKNPGFSIGDSMWQTFSGFIERATESPFEVLSMTLGSEEDINMIKFSNGDSKITPEAEKTINELIEVLQKRPEIKIELKGLWHEKADKQAAVHKKFKNLLKDIAMEDVKRDGIKTEIDLEKLIAENYENYIEKIYRNGSFDKPRNFFGFLKEQSIEVMERLIIDNIKITDKDLIKLANIRSEKVKKMIAKKSNVKANRIFLAPAEKAETASLPDKTIGVIVLIK